MTISNIRKQILERLEPLPGEQVKNLLLQWLINSSGNLEDFDRFSLKMLKFRENFIKIGKKNDEFK